MTCLNCRRADMASTRENYKYAESGLPGITLLNLEVRQCPACGERLVVIPAVEQLHRAIALAIIQKRARLTPQEVRFLRKWLGFSRTDLAQHMGVTPETVSRWESGKAAVSGLAERTLRLMVAVNPPVADYELDQLRHVDEHSAKPLRAGFSPSPHGWHAS